MRWKIVVVNAGIVVILGLLSFVLLVSSLGALSGDAEARRSMVSHALSAANARVGYDALRTQRWLSKHVDDEALRSVFFRGTVSARQEGATALANRLREVASADPSYGQGVPGLVLILDSQGTVLGRDGSALMRGERIVETYPSLRRALEGRETASDVWLSRTRQEQLLVSFAPVLGDTGQVLGVVVFGAVLNDEWLRGVGDQTSGRALLFGVSSRGSLEILARAGQAGALLSGIAAAPQIVEASNGSLRSHRMVLASGEHQHHLVGVAPLEGFDVSSGAVLLAGVQSSESGRIRELILLPIVGVTLLGLTLVLISGVLLGNYLTRPVSELEDGLLAVINGNSTLRFQIEHPDFGGLVFRINSLLNALMGVPEDTTDEEGRSSAVPSSRGFDEALAVDESLVTSTAVDRGLAAELRGLSRADYETRLFDQYVEAKRAVGDPVDEISLEGFAARLRAMEAAMVGKHERQVRYTLEVRDGAVVFVAVPVETEE